MFKPLDIAVVKWSQKEIMNDCLYLYDFLMLITSIACRSTASVYLPYSTNCHL